MLETREHFRLRTPTVVAIVAGFAAAIYLPFLGSAHVLSSHEGFIAATAQRMVWGESWLIPQYGNWDRIEKPPAYNWIVACLFRLLGGMSETATRIPAALAAIGLCIVVSIGAKRLYDARAGLAAGLIQATTVWSYLQGRLGENDMPLVFLLAIAHVALLWHWGRGERLSLPAAMVFHAALGLAVMFKGAAALPFPIATVLLWCVIRRSVGPILELVATPAILCFLAIALPWHVYAWSQLGSEALARWGYNSLGRVTGEHHLGGKPIYFYLYHVPWLMLPWIIALAANVRVLWTSARKPDQPGKRFLWVWFFAGLLFVSLATFKHKHYCYPALPPLAILCAGLVSRHIELLGRRGWRIYGAIFAVAALSFGIVSAVVHPRYDRWAPTMQFVQNRTREIPPDADLIAVGLGNSLVYPYIARPYRYLDGVPNLLAEPPEESRERWVIIGLADAESLLAQRSMSPRFDVPPAESASDHEKFVIGRLTP